MAASTPMTPRVRRRPTSPGVSRRHPGDISQAGEPLASLQHRRLETAPSLSAAAGTFAVSVVVRVCIADRSRCMGVVAGDEWAPDPVVGRQG
jgi:hypothetical protein